MHKLVSVDWVKAHVKGDEASRRAAARGNPASWHLLNNGAAELTTGGSGSHTEDYGVAAVRELALMRIRGHWDYLLKLHKLVARQRTTPEKASERLSCATPGASEHQLECHRPFK